MITKYSIDLRQFNNGESEKITFPTFDQCLMYGMHKLKRAMANRTCIVRAILIEDSHSRRIVVSPSEAELENLICVTPKTKGVFKIKTTLSGDEIDIIL